MSQPTFQSISHLERDSLLHSPMAFYIFRFTMGISSAKSGFLAYQTLRRFLLPEATRLNSTTCWLMEINCPITVAPRKLVDMAWIGY